MTYCRVVIETPERGRVYKKDFHPQALFGLLARTFASEMVKQNMVQEGESFAAIFRPRYESTLVQNGVMQKDPVKAAEPRATWLTLESSGQSDTPLTFFTMELRFCDSGVIYTQDLQILSIEYFWSTLQDTLFTLKVLEDGDTYMIRLYARDDDDQADFVHEEMRVVGDSDDAPLVELVEVVSSEPEFSPRSLGDFTIAETHATPLASLVELTGTDQTDQGGSGDVTILVAQPVLAELQTIARREVDVEQGGTLIGHVYHSTDPGGRFLVAITDHIQTEDASADLVTLRYNFESWQQRQEQLKERFPGKQIVGWYHTHLIKAEIQSGAGEEPVNSEFFFSQDDRFMHRQFFADPWYVAMVLNPSGEAVFFRWFGDRIGSSRQFHITS